ncbi:fatty acid desaturase family protein [Dyella sp.]|uniref:fatty acid desaturase family protein n=1 Tax=Dyella sp. TaxID=1869338 RepID=UPI002B472D5D|nr:fatty acid desaturase [Dyella sp.]HKT26745.1 fatty acid desaturase [Dyella sp.]
MSRPFMSHIWPKHESSFSAELRNAALAYLRDTGDHRFANARQWLKVGILCVAACGAVMVAISAKNRWVFAAGYAGFVMLVALLGINVMHDAAHGALFDPARFSVVTARRLHAWLSRAITLPLGVEAEYWRVRHVEFHHAFTNIARLDLDLEESFLIRQAPFQNRQRHHRYQHMYWPLLAGFGMFYVGWVLDWSDRLGKTPVRARSSLQGGRGWMVFMGTKLAHVTLMLALPAWAVHHAGISWGVVISAYVASQMLASYFIIGMLIGTHWAGVSFYREPQGTTMPHGWREHGLFTAVDWVPNPRWLGYWLGGLHRHATHHLFPTWHHRHYERLAALIAPIAAQHGLPFRELAHHELMAAQWNFLKEMGQAR